MQLTEKQWYALMTGLIVGKHIKKNSNNNIKNAVSINKKPVKVAKHTTIGITVGNKKSISRDNNTIKIPIMCTGVNVGVSAFACKIKWDTYLEYIGIEYGDFGNNLIINNNVTLKELVVLGQRTDNMSLNDFVLFYINFKVDNVPDNIDKLNINSIKTTGTTNYDCSLLTLKDENLYYITPIEANNGYVYFDSIYREEIIPPTIEVNGPTNFPIGGTGGVETGGTAPTGGTTVGDYNLSGYLGGAGGTGAFILVSVWQNGVMIGSDKVYVVNGQFKIGGKIPISTSSPGYGDVTIKVEVITEDEDDETPYYILIPAGGFSMVFTTEVAKEDKTFPKEAVLVQYIDSYELNDFYSIEIDSSIPADTDTNMEEIVLNDINDNQVINVTINNNINIESISLSDVSDIEIISGPKLYNINELEEICLMDINNLDIIAGPKQYNICEIDNLTLSDVNNIDIETKHTPTHTDDNVEDIEIKDIAELN